MCFSLTVQNSDLSPIAKYRPLNSHVQFYLKEDRHCWIYIAVLNPGPLSQLKNNITQGKLDMSKQMATLPRVTKLYF